MVIVVSGAEAGSTGATKPGHWGTFIRHECSIFKCLC